MCERNRDENNNVNPLNANNQDIPIVEENEEPVQVPEPLEKAPEESAQDIPVAAIKSMTI